MTGRRCPSRWTAEAHAAARAQHVLVVVTLADANARGLVAVRLVG